jgi:hypothetical protein
MARRKSGELVPIELAASQVSFNRETLHILTVRDITLQSRPRRRSAASPITTR